MHVYPRAVRPSLAVLTALVLAACGGGGGSKATPTPTASPAHASAGTTLSLEADQSQLKFNKDALTAKPGKVTIVMKNPSALQHNVAIEGSGVDAAGKIVGQNGTSTVTATLKAGTYTFYCAVDGHRQAGMQGTLTIK
jgi:plastocyanin